MAAGRKKKKNTYTLLGMFAALVILVGCYAAAVRYQDAKEAKEAAESETEDLSAIVASLATEEITEVLVDAEEYSYQLTAGENGWILNGDEEFPLDTTKTDDIAEMLASFPATRLLTESAEDLAEYGLTEPALTVTVEQSEGSTVLCIGDQSSADGGYYTCIQGQTAVYLIESSTKAVFEQTEEDFVLLDTMPSFEAEMVTGLKVASDSFREFTITDAPEDVVDLTARELYTSYLYDVYEEPVPVDVTSFSELMETYTTAAFGDLVSYRKAELATYGLDTPATAVTIWYTDSTTEEALEFTVYIGTHDMENGVYYVRLEGSNQVFLMDEETVDAIAQPDLFSAISKYTQMVNISLLGGMRLSYKETERVFEIAHETVTDEEGTETETDLFTVDGTLLSDDEQEAFRDLYQEIIAIKLVSELSSDAVLSGDPVLSLEFLAEGTLSDLLTVRYFAIEGDETHYAIEVNGTCLFAAQADAVEALITSLTEYQP